MRVLRGNDILINWSVFYDAGGVKTNVDFSNSTLSVFILDSYGKIPVEHTVSGNVISIHYGGEIQRLGTIAIDAYWQNNNTLVWSRAKKNEVVELVDNPESVTLDGSLADISITTINTSSDTFFGGTYNANFSNYYTKTEIDNKIITDYNFLSNKPLVYDEETGKYTAVNAPINFVNNINIGNFVAGASGINFTANGSGEVGTLTVRDRLILNGVEITGSGTGGLDVVNMWNVLGSTDDSDKQINVVHLTDALSGYLQTSTFDDLFEKVNIGTLETPKYAIKAKYDFYSIGEVSAFGAGSSGSFSGGGLIQTVFDYSSLGGTFNNDTLTDTFNAYTINQLHTRLLQVEAGAIGDGAVSNTERTNWNLAYANSHTHPNKSLLDAFSQSDSDVLDHLSIVNGKLKVDIDLRSGWFRSDGPTGWINDTYGGGIYMTDSTYVRVYNNKAFWVDNNIVATGEITAFGASDIRLKSNIKQINSALNFLSKVKTYEFDWNEKALSLNPLKAKRGAGVIAQEMSLLDNNFVHSIYGDYLGVDYERFIPYLIGGVNEVADEVTILKKKVAKLELEIKQLIA